MTGGLFSAYMTRAEPNFDWRRPLHPAPLWDLPEALFIVDDRGLMRLTNPQAEELADDSHLQAVHFDSELFQRGWF